MAERPSAALPPTGVSGLLEATDTAVINLDRRHAEIVEHGEKLAINIHSKFDELHQALYAREGELMAKLEGHTKQQVKSLSAQRKEVEILQTQRSFDPNTLEPRETTNTCFVPSAQLVKDCKKFGIVYYADIPRKAITEQKVTAYYRFICPLNSAPPEAKLISKITNKATKCVVREREKGEYEIEISYQPTVGGGSELIVRVGGEEVVGSPFPVALIDKLGTVINDLNKPYGVALNQAGEIIVAEGDAGIVSIFSPTGDKLRTLDTRGTAMKNPQGVAVDGDDNILVVDAGNHRLLKFSREGDLIAAIGSHGDGPGQFNDPMGVCVNSVNGKVYVVDYGPHCVHIFNSDLTFSSKLGSKGNGNGQFNYPWDVASDRSGCVYVADCYHHRVKVFTPDGGYLRQFGKSGSGNGELNSPISICVDSNDLVYVGENGSHRVSVFTCEGVFLKSFGSEGSKPGQFSSPYGIAVDQCGVVYVSDLWNDRVQKFIFVN